MRRVSAVGDRRCEEGENLEQETIHTCQNSQ